MNKQLKHVSNLVIFTRVVQAGGISKCADQLGVERTTISRRLRTLEKEMGVKLLVRTPRRVTPTRAGRHCFERCVELLEIVQKISFLGAVDKGAMLAKRIAIAATPDIVDHFLESRLTAFERSHPTTDVSRLLYSSGAAAPLDRADLIVSWETAATDAGMMRKLLPVKQSLYASPDYVSRHGEPSSVADLRRHALIDLDEESRPWIFSGPGGRTRIGVEARLRPRDLLECRESAIAGLGICRLPNYLGDQFIRYGRLIKLLPKYRCESRSLVTITPAHSIDQPRVTMLRVALEDSFATEPAKQAPRQSTVETLPLELGTLSS